MIEPGMMFAAGAPPAPLYEARQYLDRARRKAEAFVRAAAVDLRTRSVTVMATVNPDGRIRVLGVARSSGSADIDGIVERVLRSFFVADAPSDLIGATVTLALGAKDAPQAQAA